MNNNTHKKLINVIDDHHTYELDNMEDGKQILQFIKKEADADGQFITVRNGTTNEAVLQMMIHRMQSLHEKLPSEQSLEIISSLTNALRLMYERTADRLERGVENTPKA